MKAQVRVIVPTYNRAQVLVRALNSVAKQSFANWELVVVDDGSTDNTASVVEDWRAANPMAQNFTYLRCENSGVSHARNLGAKGVTAEWLAFLDSDDEWLPEKLSQQLMLGQDHVLVHGEENWWRNGIPVNTSSKYAKAGGRVFARSVAVTAISPSTTLLRSETFRAEGGFREDFPVCEDYELWLRITSRYVVGFVPNPVIHKYGGAADQLSLTHKAMDYHRVRALLPFLANQSISMEERDVVIKTIIKKCGILEKGYQKYANPEKLKQVQLWREAAFSALTQVHNTHSAAERFPRSDSKLTL